MFRGGLARRRPVSPLQFLLLLQLNESPKYGYEILKVLRDEFKDTWELKTGSFYPALRSLESRGFVETDMRADKEFYSLTRRGKALLDGLGKRFEDEYRISDRYFSTLLKWMPTALKKRMVDMIRLFASNPLNIHENLPEMLEDLDNETKLQVLGDIRKLLDYNLRNIDALIERVGDGGEP